MVAENRNAAANRNTWLLSWTTFGSRQFGSERSAVAVVTEPELPLFPQTSRDELQVLTERQKAPAAYPRRLRVELCREQAEVLFAEFQRLAASRGWSIQAIAILRSHLQILVEADIQTTADSMVRDLKVVGSCALNSRWRTPWHGAWWGDTGTVRKKHSAGAVASAVRYVANQNDPLLVWVATSWRSGASCA